MSTNTVLVVEAKTVVKHTRTTHKHHNQNNQMSGRHHALSGNGPLYLHGNILHEPNS